MPKFYLNYHILQEILKRLDLELVPRGFGILGFYSGKGWKVPRNFALFFQVNDQTGEIFSGTCPHLFISISHILN